MAENTKFVCIGLGKTGTTSIAHFMRACGFDHYSNYHETGIFKEGNIKHFLDLASKHDSFDDFPWPYLYRELNETYNCRFILSVRNNADEWYSSICRHYDRFGPHIVDYYNYGRLNPHGYRERYLDFYHSHIREVRSYFNGRPNLFEFNASEESSWRTLCSQVGVPFRKELIQAANVDGRSSIERIVQERASQVGFDAASAYLNDRALTLSQAEYVSARTSILNSARNQMRFLDLKREFGIKEDLAPKTGVSAFSLNSFLEHRMHRTEEPSVIFMTFCKNEKALISRWIQHHSSIIQNAQFLIFDDGSSDGTLDQVNALPNAHGISMPPTAGFDDEHRARFISMVTTAFNGFFDASIYLDADEFLVVDSTKYKDLEDLLRSDPNSSISGIGVEVVHHQAIEKSLDNSMIIRRERSYGLFSSSYTKPVVQRAAVEFSPGLHFTTESMNLNPHLYVFHLRYVDKIEFERRDEVRLATVRSERQRARKRGEHWGAGVSPFAELDRAVANDELASWEEEKQSFMEQLASSSKEQHGFIGHSYGIRSRFMRIPQTVQIGLRT